MTGNAFFVNHHLLCLFMYRSNSHRNFIICNLGLRQSLTVLIRRETQNDVEEWELTMFVGAANYSRIFFFFFVNECSRVNVISEIFAAIVEKVTCTYVKSNQCDAIRGKHTFFSNIFQRSGWWELRERSEVDKKLNKKKYLAVIYHSRNCEGMTTISSEEGKELWVMLDIHEVT